MDLCEKVAGVLTSTSFGTFSLLIPHVLLFFPLKIAMPHLSVHPYIHPFIKHILSAYCGLSTKDT